MNLECLRRAKKTNRIYKIYVKYLIIVKNKVRTNRTVEQDLDVPEGNCSLQ